MVDFNYACIEASKYFDSKVNISNFETILENDESWIFYAKTAGVEYGGFGVEVLKDTGEIKDFILPSKENFEKLDKSTSIVVPNEYR